MAAEMEGAALVVSRAGIAEASSFNEQLVKITADCKEALAATPPIEKVEDACKIGDMMWVKVTEIDEKGRVNLSHKDAMKEIRAKEAAGEIIK